LPHWSRSTAAVWPAPVGWIGHDATEFAVGIRSAIVHDRSLRLFAGAGIVEGSVPELEWQEIETKISVSWMLWEFSDAARQQQYQYALEFAADRGVGAQRHRLLLHFPRFPLGAADGRAPAILGCRPSSVWMNGAPRFMRWAMPAPSGKPAVLLCTSGTAAANYLPAVIEAAMDRLPLLLLSADRPPELQETGANQTIRQRQLFGSYTKWEFELPCPTETIALQSVLTTLDQAIYQARNSPLGRCI